MTPNAYRWISLAATAAFGSIVALAGCAPGGSGPIGAPGDNGDPDSQDLISADENAASGKDPITGSLSVGDELVATSSVNLRTGPSTSAKILHVVPNGSVVTLVDPTPNAGFYQIKHNGTVGWSYGIYYKANGTNDNGGSSSSSSGGNNPPPSSDRDAAIARAKLVVGFSYWWGHGRINPAGSTASTAGSCSGSCPSCSHGGSYGADCSGFVAKAWQVPSNNTDLATDDHPYSTSTFVNDGSQWSTVSRGSVLPADAMVYNSGGEGHIFLYAKGDGFGSMYAYECKGCAPGCVYNIRTASSAYHAIRHSGW